MSYPISFTERINKLLGSEADAFFKSLEEEAPVSIRINPFKVSGSFSNEEQIPWAQQGRYLPKRPSFTFDPLFHAGTYYVQEASSMFLEQAYKTVNPNNQAVRVLDLCAAPGGKSTHLLSLISSNSLLVSNEIIANRNHILQENLGKWGTANSIVTQNKAEDFTRLENYFDIVVVDAPCSGEGLFRKDKNAIEEWSEKNVNQCGIRQQDILQHAAKCCKSGGHIIYSTCTYEQIENDAQVETLLQNGFELLRVEAVPNGVIETQYGYQFFPHKVKGEGFYLSVVKKAAADNFDLASEKTFRPNKKYAEVATQYLNKANDFYVAEKNNRLYAYPVGLAAQFQFISSNLYVRQAGILLGEYKGKDFLPAHELALSIHARKDLPQVELNDEQAILYLRCENVKLDTPIRGWALATHKGFNLGWMKVMDGRINNYYPKEWRIRKASA